MDYLELTNQFWAKDAEFCFSDKETALYFYLLNNCKSAHWRNPFGLSNIAAMAKFGWGKLSFERARGRLKDAGLIDYRAGIGRGNIYRYIIKNNQNTDVERFETAIQQDVFSGLLPEKGIEKDAQTDTFSEKGIEKGTQTNPFYGQNSEKGIVKGTQTNPFYGQNSEKGIVKGTQTDPFYKYLTAETEDYSEFSASNKELKSSLIYTHTYINNKNNINKNINKEIENKNECANKEGAMKNEKIEKKPVQNENEVLTLYRSVCRSFPQIMRLTVGRKEKIMRRMSEMGGIKILEQVFCKMEASDFLKGNNRTGWKATFDWVFKNSDNWMKILEGNYDNQINRQHIVKPVNDARFMGMLQTDLSKF
jgi:hypothetical protein